MKKIFNIQYSIFNHKSRQGFTLMGALIIIVIIGVALPGILISLNQAAHDLVITENTALATMLAQDLAEEIKSKKWDENTPATGGSIPNGQKSDPLGPEAGQTRSGGANTFNDIDDYNGLDDSPPVDGSGNTMTEYSVFRIQVQVIYVEDSDLDTQDVGPPLPNYKRIEITVSWGSSSSIDLVTVMSNY